MPALWSRTWFRLAEAGVAALLLVLVLQAALGFNLLDGEFWRLFALPGASIGPLARGLLGTLTYMGIVIPVGFGAGLLWSWARVSRFRVLSWPVGAVIEILRGVPPLVLVIFAAVFGALLLRGIVPRPTEAALLVAALALALHSAAYQAEILRAGFQSVPRGQIEAAQALGLTGAQVMFRVVLPQGLRLSLPPLANEFSIAIKDTSLLAAIGATELFAIGLEFGARVPTSGNLSWLFLVWLAVAAVYFVITFAVTRGLRAVEGRIRVPGLEGVRA